MHNVAAAHSTGTANVDDSVALLIEHVLLAKLESAACPLHST